MQIKDEVVTADFKLADDHWHYVGVVRDSLTGNVSVYIERDEIIKGPLARVRSLNSYLLCIPTFG